jgi:DNA-binding PadR family transcriptional regulator
VEPSVSAPPRRYYTITPKGRELLPLWRGLWEETRDFVDAILGEAPSAAGRTRSQAAAGIPPVAGGDDRG